MQSYRSKDQAEHVQGCGKVGAGGVWRTVQFTTRAGKLAVSQQRSPRSLQAGCCDLQV